MDEWTEPALRLFAAVAVGGVVGLNRDLFGKPTGARVHALVALGAACYVIAAEHLGGSSEASRAIQGIVGGVGFLGAGVIIHGPGSAEGGSVANGGRRAGFDIHYLGTAASIWLTAALGVAAGLGQWRLGVLATVAALFVLIVGIRVDRAMFARFGRSDDRGDPLE